MPLRIGHLPLAARVLLAPMAGITDLPMRTAARRWGAGLACAEMLTADTQLWTSSKSASRLPDTREDGIRAVQIAGYDPTMLAEAARQCEALGAEVIDINMGCPAKKVCNRAAGSALLRDEQLVADILQAVVAAVAVPVTLKYRTGWSPSEKNAVRIAQLAEDSGIAAIALHGRTRACGFTGSAEHESLADVVRTVSIPVIANGDICDGAQARRILEQTGASAVMIGRAALGRPWLLGQIADQLEGRTPVEPSLAQKIDTMRWHLLALHRQYPSIQGVRIARKHIGWYLQALANDLSTDWLDLRSRFYRFEDASQQEDFLSNLAAEPPPLAAALAA